MTDEPKIGEVIRRRDSFDIGQNEGEFREIKEEPQLLYLLSNPDQIIKSLNLTSAQAANIRSLIVGSGTGFIHRWLSSQLGDEISGAVGGFISAYIAKRIVGKSG